MPYTLRMNLKLPSIPAMPTAGLVQRIRQRFQDQAGTYLLDAIRSHLGTDPLYTLSPEYAARKPQLRKFRRFPGKASTQPIILSGELYNALTVIPKGDGFVVMVDDGQGLSDKGYDYAEKMEELTLYLEHGLLDVENDLDQILLDIIFDEMAL